MKSKPLFKHTQCHARIYAIGLNSVYKSISSEGIGFIRSIQLNTVQTNVSYRVGCSYITDPGYAAGDLREKPPTVAIAMYCPVSTSHLGKRRSRYLCTLLRDRSRKVEVGIHLGASNSSEADLSSLVRYSFVNRSDLATTPSSIEVGPSLPWTRTIYSTGPESLPGLDEALQSKWHAVCTAQVFRNPSSGLHLYLFAAYYRALGYLVIIYDRFGWHRDYLTDFIGTEGFQYHPYTSMQVAHPQKYGESYIRKQNFEYQYYFTRYIEPNSTSIMVVNDRLDQDRDKRRTYDAAVVAYAHVRSMLIVDADELLVCRGVDNVVNLKENMMYMNYVVASKIREVHFYRLNYFGKHDDTHRTLSHTELHNMTTNCMSVAFDNRNLSQMLNCWGAMYYDSRWMKSVDVSSGCPFHYAHWACSPSKDKLDNRCECAIKSESVERCEMIHLANKCRRHGCRLVNVNKRDQPNQDLALLSLQLRD